MSESGPDAITEASTSIPPKRRLWIHLFLWGFLGGGILFSGFLVFLIRLTLPDLRREGTPPEISGTEQIARVDNNEKTLRPDNAPTSRTAVLDQSGRVVLNLDDFPHLSPTMRQFAEAWVEAWNETIRKIEVIDEPVLRGQLLEKMSRYADAFKSLLDFPVEWEKNSYGTSRDKIRLTQLQMYELFDRDIGYLGVRAKKSEEEKRIDDDIFRTFSMFHKFEYRMYFELAIQAGEWVDAAHQGYLVNDERVFCFRQMGFAGKMVLAADFLKRRFEDQPIIGSMCDKVEDRTCSVWQNWIKPR
jgi:hypothetical protein